MTSTLPVGVGRMAFERMYPPESPYKNDPVLWAEQKLRKFLWSVQKEILESVRDNRMTAVQSCHGPGKSFSSSIAAAWWLDPEVHPLGSAFALTTAPSWPQVQTILWREIRRRFNEGELPGRITLDCQWHLAAEGAKRASSTEEIIAMGRKPADYDQHTLQGLHARYFLAILDEAGGIDEFLWNAVLALVTNENARVLAIGNPDDPNSRFANVCSPDSGWNVIKIPVWDTPLFTQKVCEEWGWTRTRPEESVPDDVAEGLVSPMWVRDREKDYGIGSPVWVAKICGEFPDISDEYLISPSLLRSCQNLDLPGFDTGRYGLDIARQGTDKSALYRNRGGVIRRVAVWAKQDTMQSAGRAAMVFLGNGANQVPCTVDIIGLGAGVFDRLREQGFPVAPHQGSQSALNKLKFYNRRSEVYWMFRKMMEEGRIDLDPEDDVLAAQLTSIKWDVVDSTGKIKIESKEDMAKRGMPSPDLADAAVLSTVSAASVPEVTHNSEVEEIVSDLMNKVM